VYAFCSDSVLFQPGVHGQLHKPGTAETRPEPLGSHVALELEFAGKRQFLRHHYTGVGQHSRPRPAAGQRVPTLV